MQALFNSTMFGTALFVGILFLARFFVLRWIRDANSAWTADQRLKATRYVRTFFVVIMLVGFLYIWGERVQSTITSLFAIAFAIVFSVKELLMCISGSVTRLRGMTYDLGDRITVKNFKGDVIDINLLSTTLLEVGPGTNSHQHTGRKITFPNSLLVTEEVSNESFLENFYLHNIKVPLKREENWERGKEILLEIATNECAPYLEQARRRLREIEKKRSIQMPSVDPRVWVELPDCETTHLYLRFTVPSHLKDRLEQSIVSHFLSKFYSPEEEASSEESATEIVI